ncbi:thioredoxin fold domain-containing protein [Croceivirga sp. JEA036]|nr:thioredoxin fold domain-containing protein [Croceivirga sp. JEA036]
MASTPTIKPFKTLLILALVALVNSTVNAQKSTINWLSFEQLEDSLAVKQKKVFINFYADWCAYCKKMDAASFKDKEVIAKLNSDFYAVKMNAESKEAIAFRGELFTNKQLETHRNPTHELALVLASRPETPFSLPTTIILDKDFNITQRYFEYLSPQKLLSILN